MAHASSQTSQNSTPVQLPTLEESVSPTGGSLPIPSGLPGDSDDQYEIVRSPVAAQRGFGGSQPVAHVLKVIVLGDASVGKTALIQRFVNGSYQSLPYKPTVGADFYSQKMDVLDKKTGAHSMVTLQIWDTAGQERYRSLASSFYRGADVCLLVFDGTRSASSLASLELWRSDFLRYAAPIDPDNFPFVILCNKSDLIVDERDRIAAETVLGSIPDRLHVKRVLSVSAKSGENVEKAFQMAAKTGLERITASGKQARQQPPSVVQLGSSFGRPTTTQPTGNCSNQC
jgi:Ras-related protein Rab-7A